MREDGWECGGGYGSSGQTYPPLPQGSDCHADSDSERGSFIVSRQFDEGNNDEVSSLNLPKGTGIPIGGETGIKSLVAVFHFRDRNRTSDGRSGVSQVDVRIVNQKDGMQGVGELVLEANGFVGENSVASVSGSWILDQELVMRPVLLYSHTHDLAIDLTVTIEGKDGQNARVLYQEDRRQNSGVTRYSQPDPSSLIRPGDRVTVTCTYNNTRSSVLRVQ